MPILIHSHCNKETDSHNKLKTILTQWLKVLMIYMLRYNKRHIQLKRKLNTVMKTEPKNHKHLCSPVPSTPRSKPDSLLIVPYTSNWNWGDLYGSMWQGRIPTRPEVKTWIAKGNNLKKASMKSHSLFNFDVDIFCFYVVGTLFTCPIIYRT